MNEIGGTCVRALLLLEMCVEETAHLRPRFVSRGGIGALSAAKGHASSTDRAGWRESTWSRKEVARAIVPQMLQGKAEVVLFEPSYDPFAHHARRPNGVIRPGD